MYSGYDCCDAIASPLYYLGSSIRVAPLTRGSQVGDPHWSAENHPREDYSAYVGKGVVLSSQMIICAYDKDENATRSHPEMFLRMFMKMLFDGPVYVY